MSRLSSLGTLSLSYVLSSACRPGDPSAQPRAVDVTLSGSPKTVLEKRLSISTSDDLDLELTCTSPSAPGEEHILHRIGPGELRLYGLLADTPYLCTLRDEDDGAVLWSESFLTEPLPEGLPRLVLATDPQRSSVAGGYLLFNHWKLGAGQEEIQRLIIADGQGQIRWYLAFLEAKTGGLAGSWMPERQQLVTGGGQGSSPALRDLSGDALFEVPDPLLPEQGYHHEAIVTSEGWLVSLQGVMNSKGDASFIGFRIEAYDPETGALMWEYDSQTDVDSGVLPPATPQDIDPYHANAISFVDDDPEGPAVWVTLRGLGTIARIDRASRTITRQIGPELGLSLVDPDGNALPETAWFWGQHDPEISVVDGALDLLLYDNGGRRPGAGSYSRVAHYRISGTTATLWWDWSEPRWYEPNFGSTDWLDDGHVLIGTGHCGDCGETGDVGWIAEVDPATDSVVYRLDFDSDDDSLYRAEYIDGCAIFANTLSCPSRR